MFSRMRKRFFPIRDSVTVAGGQLCSVKKSLMKKLLAALLIIFVTTAQAQDNKEKEAIKNLCGCYEVEFMYTETFAVAPTYKLSKPYNAHGLEWVGAVEMNDKKMVLQHLLVISDTTVIKHWREDWEFEKAGLWKFDYEAAWKYDATAAKRGEWTQTVWETDDAPRYQGSSKWINNNGKYYWENTTDAPLPRREYSVRSDYNVLERGNKVIVNETGWIHEQDNRKIQRATGTADKVLAQEKGFNIYTKVDDSRCALAAAWWKQHGEFWNAVRLSWDEVLKGKTSVKLLPKVDGQPMWQHMDKLEKEKLADAQLRAKAKTILSQFAQTNNATAMGISNKE
jgi:hypothetical protein